MTREMLPVVPGRWIWPVGSARRLHGEALGPDPRISVSAALRVRDVCAIWEGDGHGGPLARSGRLGPLNGGEIALEAP